MPIDRKRISRMIRLAEYGTIMGDSRLTELDDRLKFD